MAAVRLDPFWVLPELYALANIERLRSLGKNSGADPGSVFLALDKAYHAMSRAIGRTTILGGGLPFSSVMPTARDQRELLPVRARSLERIASKGHDWHRRRDRLEVPFVEAPARQFPLEDLLDLLAVAENPRLSARDREALFAAARGLSDIEAAEELGCSPDAYRQRLRAARAKCRH